MDLAYAVQPAYSRYLCERPLFRSGSTLIVHHLAWIMKFDFQLHYDPTSTSTFFTLPGLRVVHILFIKAKYRRSPLLLRLNLRRQKARYQESSLYALNCGDLHVFQRCF